MKKKIMSIAVITIFGLIAACTKEPSYDVVFPLPDTVSNSSSIESKASSSNEQQATSNPSSVLISVPFQSQAPFKNWDPLHEEACEEASLILVARYLNGQSISEQEMEEEIQALVAWEHEHGYGEDVTAGQILEIAKEYYGLNGRLIDNVSAATLKAELIAGNPVIIPAAGRMLGNPYYSGLGPPYHMIVVTGFGVRNFITQDVGTRRGERYPYNEDVLIDAIHDWTGDKETIETGAKRMVVLYR